MVLVDSSSLGEHASVESDDTGGARAAAEHLLSLGHRDLLVVGVEPAEAGAVDDPGSVPSRRLRGYREALADAGIELDDGRIVAAPASLEGGMTAFRRAWQDGLRPSAVLAMSDAMAIGVIRAAHDLGLAVPADVSVVGFDDIDLAEHVDPALTTVHQPIRRKGEAAARLLLSFVDGREPEVPEHRQLETRLIVRASTSAPRSQRR